MKYWAKALNGALKDDLHKPYIFAILSHMKTTLNIDDQILEEAKQLTGIKEKTTLVKMGLKALIARESAKRLIALGGTEKSKTQIPRRRP